MNSRQILEMSANGVKLISDYDPLYAKEHLYTVFEVIFASLLALIWFISRK